MREENMDADDVQQPLGHDDDMEGVKAHMEEGTFEANLGNHMDKDPQVNLDNYEDVQKPEAEKNVALICRIGMEDESPPIDTNVHALHQQVRPLY